METALATYDVEGKVPTRTGDAHPSLSPFEAYDAQDGRFIIAAGNDQLFMLMADALGNPQMALEPQFLSNAQRCRNRPALIEAIQAITLTAPAAHWIDRLNEAGVPCSPINTIDKLFEHPQLAARNMIIQVQGEGGRAFRTAGNPIKLNAYADIDVTTPLRAPGLDQHRERILSQLMSNTGDYAPATGPFDESLLQEAI
jgi:CoA:oxalate CoA-transferase